MRVVRRGKNMGWDFKSIKYLRSWKEFNMVGINIIIG